MLTQFEQHKANLLKSGNKGKSSSKSHLLNMRKLCQYFSSFALSVNII